jgi:polysaccharide biosynthesis/export protein
MKLTSTQLSIFALGAFATLVGNELARSSGLLPKPATPNSNAPGKNAKRPQDTTPREMTASPAQPEQLLVQRPASAAVAPEANLGAFSQAQSPVSSSSDLAQQLAALPPPPPKPTIQPVQRRSPSYSPPSIDAIVNASIASNTPTNGVADLAASAVKLPALPKVSALPDAAMATLSVPPTVSPTASADSTAPTTADTAPPNSDLAQPPAIAAAPEIESSATTAMRPAVAPPERLPATATAALKAIPPTGSSESSFARSESDLADTSQPTPAADSPQNAPDLSISSAISATSPQPESSAIAAVSLPSRNQSQPPVATVARPEAMATAPNSPIALATPEYQLKSLQDAHPAGVKAVVPVKGLPPSLPQATMPSQTAAIAPVALPPTGAPSSRLAVQPAPVRSLPSATPGANRINASDIDPDTDAYTLGGGDRIRVDVFSVPEFSREYQLQVNGSVNLVRAGTLSLKGLTVPQAQAAISRRYAQIVQRPVVDVGLLVPRPLRVAIAGEVNKPGTYPIAIGDGGKFPSITNLIQQAGGMNQSANPRQVTVRRAQRGGGQQVINVDMWDLFQTGNIRQDLVLRDGDSIFVPPASSFDPAESSQLAAANFATGSDQPLNVAVVGEVNRPGPLVLTRETRTDVRQGNSISTTIGARPTVTQAIQKAGGITQLANIRQVEVRRQTRAGAVQTLPVDLWSLLKTGNLDQDVVLQQGDTIVIPKSTGINPQDAKELGSASFAPSVMRINIVGEVPKPGFVELRPNTPLNQAVLAAGGYTRQARKSPVVLVRLNPDGTVTRRHIAVDFNRSIDEKDSNPILQDNDIVIVERSNTANFIDTIETITNPLGRILPFRGLF